MNRFTGESEMSSERTIKRVKNKLLISDLLMRAFLFTCLTSGLPPIASEWACKHKETQAQLVPATRVKAALLSPFPKPYKGLLILRVKPIFIYLNSISDNNKSNLDGRQGYLNQSTLARAGKSGVMAKVSASRELIFFFSPLEICTKGILSAQKKKWRSSHIRLRKSENIWTALFSSNMPYFRCLNENE